MEIVIINGQRYLGIDTPAKTKHQTKPEKAFDTVNFFREVKENIARETRDMTFAEFKRRLDQRTLKKAS